MNLLKKPIQIRVKKLKSGIKDGPRVTKNLSSNVIGGTNDETNFPHKLLLTNTQVSKIRKNFFFRVKIL